jgi:hypothetical protein
MPKMNRVGSSGQNPVYRLHHRQIVGRPNMISKDGEMAPGLSDVVSEEEAEHDRLFQILIDGMTSETAQRDLLKNGPVGQELL